MRVAVLGAGRIGSFRARVLKGLPGVDEIVVGNRTVERAEKLAGEVGGEGGTIQEALDLGRTRSSSRWLRNFTPNGCTAA